MYIFTYRNKIYRQCTSLNMTHFKCERHAWLTTGLCIAWGCSWFGFWKFYILATSEVISRWVLTDLWHSVRLPRHWDNQSLHYPNNAEHLARKPQVSIFRSLASLDPCLNLWGPNPLISQKMRRTLNSFGHPHYYKQHTVLLCCKKIYVTDEMNRVWRHNMAAMPHNRFPYQFLSWPLMAITKRSSAHSLERFYGARIQGYGRN